MPYTQQTLDLLKNKWGFWVLILASAGILWADHATGREIRILYLLIIPVSIASLTNRLALAYALAVALPFTRLLFFVDWETSFFLTHGLVNASIRAFVLLFVAYFMNKVSMMFKYRQELENLKLRERVERLEGLLPICAHCKNIRNADGEYEMIESYIAKHSDVVFSHGVCPECLRKFYPEHAERILSRADQSR